MYHGDSPIYYRYKFMGFLKFSVEGSQGWACLEVKIQAQRYYEGSKVCIVDGCDWLKRSQWEPLQDVPGSGVIYLGWLRLACPTIFLTISLSPKGQVSHIFISS